MKKMHYLIFSLLSTFELAFANNDSVTINMTVTADPVSNVHVDQSSIDKTLTDIFDLRDTSNGDENFSDVVVTYQTNNSNQKLTLASSQIHNDNFYLHHSNHTSDTPIRLLLNITRRNEKITPSNNILIKTNDIVLDSTLTLNIKLKPDTSNAVHAGDYTSTLTVAWMSNG